VALEELFDNFPSKVLGKTLKLIIMPFGKKYKRPSDELEHQVARLLQTPCDARSRLGAGQYLSREQGLMGDLEQTLENVLAAEPIYNKVCKAANEYLPFTELDKVADKGLELEVITEEQATLLRETEKGRLRTINVDDFKHSELVQTADKEKPKRKPRAKKAS
jgi:acyl-CoA dehydrogenase